MSSSPILAFMVVLIAAIAATFTGFGFNLISVPLLALLIAPHEAVVVALILGVLVSGLTAAMSTVRGEVNHRVLADLVVGSLPGVLIGVLLLDGLSPSHQRSAIGVVTLVSACVLFAMQGRHAMRQSRPSNLGTGAVGGSLAVVTGTGGPPVAAYLMVLPLQPAVVRGTLVSYITLVSVLALGGTAANSGLSLHEVGVAVALVPAAVVGLAVGVALFHRLPSPVYRPASSVLLVAIGISGILLAVRS